MIIGKYQKHGILVIGPTGIRGLTPNIAKDTTVLANLPFGKELAQCCTVFVPLPVVTGLP